MIVQRNPCSVTKKVASKKWPVLVRSILKIENSDFLNQWNLKQVLHVRVPCGEAELNKFTEICKQRSLLNLVVDRNPIKLLQDYPTEYDEAIGRLWEIDAHLDKNKSKMSLPVFYSMMTLLSQQKVTLWGFTPEFIDVLSKPFYNDDPRSSEITSFWLDRLCLDPTID